MARGLRFSEAEVKALTARRPGPVVLTQAQALALLKPARRAKYGNRKVIVDGETFDSQWEHDYYQTLLWRQRAGEIANLRRQVRYPLYFAGERLGRYAYIADFTYTTTADGRFHVVDTKGMKTREFKLKRELVERHYGFAIELVQRDARLASPYKPTKQR